MARRIGSRMNGGELSRRGFLQVLVVSGGAALLAACQSAPAAAPTTALPQRPPSQRPRPRRLRQRQRRLPEPRSGQAAAPRPSWRSCNAWPSKRARWRSPWAAPPRGQISPVFKQFEEKYNVKVTGLIGSGTENAQKVLAERDTGLFTADVWMGSYPR